MNRFIITEEEKKNILDLYGVLNEQDNGGQRLNLGEISGKTYDFYLNLGKQNKNFEWINSEDVDKQSGKMSGGRPTPEGFLPNFGGKKIFKISPKTLTYWSGQPQYNYSFATNLMTDDKGDKYVTTQLYTDKNMIKNSKFRVGLNFPLNPIKENSQPRFFMCIVTI